MFPAMLLPEREVKADLMATPAMFVLGEPTLAAVRSDPRRAGASELLTASVRDPEVLSILYLKK